MSPSDAETDAEARDWLGLLQECASLHAQVRELTSRVSALRAALNQRQAAIDAAAKALRDVENVL